MNKQQHFRRSFLALALGVFGASGTALAAVAEEETNDLLNAAQVLAAESDLSVARNGVELQGAMLPKHPVIPDVDFYTFYATEGQKVSFRVEAQGFDAVLTVVNPMNKVEAEDRPATAGEQVGLDDVLLNATGMWSVVITPALVLIKDPGATTFGDLVLSGSRVAGSKTGSYKLVVTPAAPAVLPIGLEIKPGSGERAPINPKARGVVPVALLAAPDFDPFKIDVNSLTFGATGDETSFRRCAPGGQDVDADGDLDRVCTFENQAAKFTESSSMGYLKGRTTDGVSFQGQGFLKALPVQNQ